MSFVRMPPFAPFARCLALLCVLTQSAAALQLGETRAQLVARHGAPGAEDHARNLAMYFWEGWSAQVEFQDNIVRRLTYRRNWYLQEAEINSLLQSNGGSGRWREVSVAGSGSRHWVRDDRAAATCAREKPVSIVFQVAGLAEPTVVLPATPSPGFVKAPTFPKMLGAVPEPELPLADPPLLLSEPAASEPPARPLPKLPAAEIQPEATTPAPEAAPAAVPTPTAPEPRTEPAGAASVSPVLSSASGETPSHGFAYTLGAFAVLAALAGGGVYLRKRRRTPPGQTRFSALRVVEASPGSPRAAPGVDSLRVDQFELLLGEIFRRQGYTVELSAALNADDGIDLTLRRDSETSLVQCKHWKTARVTERELHEFYGAMTASGAPRGIFVTTGEFAPDARAFAESKGIELIDGNVLRLSIAAAARPGENLCHVPSWLDEFVAHARIFDPECPVCHGTMVIRHNRANGVPSWNCRGYPRCPGRREPRLDLLPNAAAH
ncbi:MAG TPA: restriction endonuclease [Chthoniobacter sp.]|jgi:hypothetical protein